MGSAAWKTQQIPHYFRTGSQQEAKFGLNRKQTAALKNPVSAKSNSNPNISDRVAGIDHGLWIPDPRQIFWAALCMYLLAQEAGNEHFGWGEEEGAAGCEVSRSTRKGNVTMWRRAEPLCWLCKQRSLLQTSHSCSRSARQWRALFGNCEEKSRVLSGITKGTRTATPISWKR